MAKKRILKYFLVVALAIAVLAGAAFGYLLWEETKIPKLYFEGDISGMKEKTDVREISFVYKDGKEEIAGYAEIKPQGTSSLAYDKKNFTIKFFEDAEHEDKLKIDVGWGAQSKYCLKANWVDRTHSRNVVTAKLASQIWENYGLLMQAPKNGLVDGFPIEIYNNGEFYGIYTFNIPKDSWQFGMDEENPDHIVVGGETYNPTNLFQELPDFGSWEVEVGEGNEETLQKLTRMFDFVINSTDEEFKSNFEEYLDLDAALNYYIMVDYCHLADNHGQNMLLATYDGLKWYLSLYDLDTSWGTRWNGYTLHDYEEALLDMSRNNLFARMETCFAKELSERYFELRENFLNKAYVMGEFESFEDQIPTMSFIRETLRWGKGMIKRPADIPGFDISQIAQYIESAESRLDEKYAKLGSN